MAHHIIREEFMSVADDSQYVQRRKWRWKLLTVWIVIFTATTIWSLHQIQSDSARASALEHTNCGLKIFLLTARHARLVAAAGEEGRQKDLDLAAAAGYQVLVKRITAVGEHCTIPPDILS
jgi:hypothetical protein